MLKTPSSLRLNIGIFGRTNVGKSTILNLILGQDASITSSYSGTTTDVVKRAMELLPIGPVLFLDTAGLGDGSELSAKREEKTWKALRRSDVAIVIVESGKFTEFEKKLFQKIESSGSYPIIIVNKIDIKKPNEEYLSFLKKYTENILFCNALNNESRDKFLNDLKRMLKQRTSNSIRNNSMFLNLVKPKSHVILIVPIDIQAPKGRIILPQVQAIRDCLDNDCIISVVKESEYKFFLNKLNEKPDLVVCDSQVVHKMVENTPKDILCTTFSILSSRLKGNLEASVEGVLAIEKLEKNSKILIAESCTHHPLEVDIGRIQIPGHLKNYLGYLPKIEVCSGKDFPDDLSSYDLVIHCGGCMINFHEMKNRVQNCIKSSVPITNYGVCISYLNGVLFRVIEVFPEFNELYQETVFSDKVSRR